MLAKGYQTKFLHHLFRLLVIQSRHQIILNTWESGSTNISQWKKHIASKCSAATINIRCIAAMRRFIDLDTAKLLASSLVLTHLDYSNSVLCRLPKKSIMRLQRIQNWAAKVVLQRDKFSSSAEALNILHWLPVKDRIEYKILCIIYKCLNNLAPSYLSS